MTMTEPMSFVCLSLLPARLLLSRSLFHSLFLPFAAYNTTLSLPNFSNARVDRFSLQAELEPFRSNEQGRFEFMFSLCVASKRGENDGGSREREARVAGMLSIAQ